MCIAIISNKKSANTNYMENMNGLTVQVLFLCEFNERKIPGNG